MDSWFPSFPNKHEYMFWQHDANSCFYYVRNCKDQKNIPREYFEYKNKEKEILESVKRNSKSVDKGISGIRKFNLDKLLWRTSEEAVSLIGNRMAWLSPIYIAKCLCEPFDKPHGKRPVTMPEHYSTNFIEATCGVYSFKEDAPIDSEYEDFPVTAIVKNYGFIVEMERGYRSEICEIQSIFINQKKISIFSRVRFYTEEELREGLAVAFPNIPIYFSEM